MSPKTKSQTSSPTSPSGLSLGAPSPSAAALAAPSPSRDRDRSPSVVDRKEALDLATRSEENVFLFVPNLIGYARVILAGFSLVVMPYHPKLCTAVYFVSSILDVADGQAARRLNQTSKFGGVLDMVTDRCATACLLCFLAMAFPRWALLFQFLITLDFASHYMHMYSSLATGSASHKDVTKEDSWILYSYYHNRITLFIFCFCNETFFVTLYLLKWYNKPVGFPAHLLTSLLPFNAANLLGPEITKLLVYADNFVANLSVPMLAAVICFPICFGKQVINVVQFWKASKILVGLDLAERKAARQEKILKSI